MKALLLYHSYYYCRLGQMRDGEERLTPNSFYRLSLLKLYIILWYSENKTKTWNTIDPKESIQENSFPTLLHKKTLIFVETAEIIIFFTFCAGKSVVVVAPTRLLCWYALVN